MGREFVLQLSRYVQVDEIWAIARRAENLEALKRQVVVPVRPVPLDLCAAESFDTFAALLESEKPDVKLLVMGVKLLPHSLIMNIWLSQQKKARNNTGLTTK